MIFVCFTIFFSLKSPFLYNVVGKNWFCLYGDMVVEKYLFFAKIAKEKKRIN